MEPISPAAAATTQVVAAYNRLGFALLHRLADGAPEANLLLSPLSIALALAMTYEGAAGATAAALAHLLHDDTLAADDFRSANRQLVEEMRAAGGEATLAVANALWLSARETLAPDFIARLAEGYGARATALDFTAPEAAPTINRWVEANTQGKIAELVTPAHLLQAFLVLTNAIYLKGLWQRPFDQALTQPGPFRRSNGSTVEVPMMHAHDLFTICETEDFQALKLAFRGGRLAMLFLLPRQVRGGAIPAPQFHFAQWHALRDGWHRQMVRLTLPRFVLAYGADILAHLTALAGPALAGPDFTRMCAGPALITNVLHKAWLEVNEEGAEAAAATAVVMARSLPAQFAVDRPFACAIVDEPTGALLFVGRVMDPAQARADG